MITLVSKYLLFPLWDIKDKSIKMKTLSKLEKSQWMPENTFQLNQWQNLISILEYAYENCTYYKSIFSKNQITPHTIKSYPDLLKVTILTKKMIQDNTDDLISKLYNKETLISSKTGGSTGKSLTLFFNKECEEMRNAAAWRSDRWANWDLGDMRAAIWGNPPKADTLKKKIRSELYDRIIYLDTMDLNEKSMMEFIDVYRKYKPPIIFGHSHSIYIFARFLEEKGIIDLKPKGIISTSMMLMPHERELIERVFQCKVTDRYGCEEVGLIASECEKHEGMHLNIDHLYIEFIKEDGSPAKPGEEGNIVVTDLINRGMPLIRYKVEDVGVPTDRKCSCGRGLPLMEKVAGRVADFLLRRDGSLVAGVSLVERTLTAIKGIEQMQIVQEALDDIILNLVKGVGYCVESENQLLNEFKNIFGKDIRIKVNTIDNIPQECSGKYRFSICKLKNSDINHRSSQAVSLF
jgi:phenylacetate-CoA ligase